MQLAEKKDEKPVMAAGVGGLVLAAAAWAVYKGKKKKHFTDDED